MTQRVRAGRKNAMSNLMDREQVTESNERQMSCMGYTVECRIFAC